MATLPSMGMRSKLALDVVGQVGDGKAALEATLSLQPDVVLMDIHMPRMSGLEALVQIKQISPQTQVVMLTVSEEDADLAEAIKGGAQGYLLKSLNSEEFLGMLDGLRRGEAAMSRQTTAQLMQSLAKPSPQHTKPIKRLTQRETELLKLVAQGMSNKAIARKLSVSENTVKYHLKNIMQRLDVQNRTEAVTHAIRAGLIEPPSF